MNRHTPEIEFEAQIDEWVRDAAHRHTSFASLVQSLPGVYPGFVETSLVRQSISIQHGCSERLLRLDGPIPHPTDGDWRFHPESWQVLSKLLQRRPIRDLAILACPSLVKPLMPAVERISLADSNVAWKEFIPNGVEVSWGDVSLAAHRWPQRFDAAIMDPPWYPLEFARFLSIAAALLKLDGTLYVSFPAIGTRPGMARERSQLIRTARRFGLALDGTRHSVLRYATPYYEGSALRAEGLPVLAGWRHSDLVAFRRTSDEYTHQIDASDERQWTAVSRGRLQLRIRTSAEPTADSCDPRLISLVKGDVLPSVSHRDPRRKVAVAWTAGNRIFRCESPQALRDLAAATMQGQNPRLALEERYGRSLAASEVRNIIEAEAQLDELESIEAQTYDDLHEDFNGTATGDSAKSQIAAQGPADMAGARK